MCSSTMINLRNISPLVSSAAMLPAHELRFNIPGIRGVEPSSASVEPVDCDDEIVHGTLYKLSEEDFNIICRTEGVPFAYSLHRCRVVPYTGDGKRAGEEKLQKILNTSAANEKYLDKSDIGVSAFTLRAARNEWRKGQDIPPSKSYLNVLIRGAIEYKMDEAYVNKLKSIQVGKTWVGDGMAEEMLRLAERRNGIR